MPTYRHPRAADDSAGPPPARVHVSRADKRSVDADGTFDAPAAVAATIAAAHDTTADAMRVDGGGDSVAAAIEAGVCPWCDDYEGDAVAQHASSAHSDKWAAHSED
jgi:hypothetical protein